jgi:hypothetical protein
MFGKLACKCHRCVARRRIRFVLGLGLVALLLVGYLAIPNSRINVPDLSQTDVANVALPENTSPKSLRTAEPAASVWAPDSAAEPVPGALTRTDKLVSTPQQEPGATPGNGEKQLNVQKESSATPPVAAEHRSVVVAGVQPRPESANPAAIGSPDLPGPAQQDSKPANALSSATPNPSPAASPPSSENANLRGPGANGARTGLVASQTNNAVEVSTPTPAPSPSSASRHEANELHGYIAFATKNEPAASPRPAQQPAKAPGNRVTADETPPEPRESARKTEDIPAATPKPAYRSGRSRSQFDKLEDFASDFVRTDRSKNIGEERRFYADSVHFYNEGDLSWASVAAATRRYHQGGQNKQFQAAGSATVKGPVDGGFYVVDQPVTWSRMEGSSLVRGRSLLRMRVLPSGTTWKITSIEEVGQ